MTPLQTQVLDKVRDRLGPQRLDAAIVYLHDELQRDGNQVAIAGVVVQFPWDGYLVFVDLEPQANWGHACCYLAVRSDGSEFVEVPATMPPFLKAGGLQFRLLWRGSKAPQWAVVDNASN